MPSPTCIAKTSRANEQLGECPFHGILKRIAMHLEGFEHTHSGEPSRVVRTDGHQRKTPSNELVVESFILGEPLRAPCLSHSPDIAEHAKGLRSRCGGLIELHLEFLDLFA